MLEVFLYSNLCCYSINPQPCCSSLMSNWCAGSICLHVAFFIITTPKQSHNFQLQFYAGGKCTHNKTYRLLNVFIYYRT